MHALLRQEGTIVNQKKVQRLWREEGLQVSQRRRHKRRTGGSSGLPTRAKTVNHVWTWDFIQDRTEDGRALRILTVMDEFSRFNVGLHVARSITAEQVIEQLEEAIAAYGKPSFIRSDNGPEFVAKAISAHLQARKVGTLYIAPGSPWQNPYVESFHSRLRDECLDREIFGHRLEAQAVVADFREHYNHKRPHSALKYQAPAVIFSRPGGPGASTELFTAASSTPTSMVTHSRLVGSHNNSNLNPN
ncbi:MAG: putative transposase [Rhodothermales bacterium]|jgi:putative transposase